MLDGKAFGAEVVETVKTYVSRVMQPVEIRLGILEGREIPKGEKGDSGQDGKDGRDGRDAETEAPDEVADQLNGALKLLAAQPDMARHAGGSVLQMPSIELPAPVVHVQMPEPPPKKRLKTIVKAHDANGRITELEQVEVDD
jgi:hypothetical protein